MEPTIKGAWVNGLRVRVVHPAGDSFTTDGPVEYGGGAGFSPTDLLAAALGACSLSVAVMVGERLGCSMAGSQLEATRKLASQPVRISEIAVVLHLPEDVADEHRARIQQAAQRCPVRESLHPDIAVQLDFRYDVRPAARLATAPVGE
jgi:putative redox protein